MMDYSHLKSPLLEECREANPYLAEFIELGCAHNRFDSIMSNVREGKYPLDNRDRLVKEYAWAVPNQAALDAIAACGPIVEIGAGGGYWAYLLRKMGVDIVCYDRAPVVEDNTYIRKVWTEVLEGEPEAVLLHQDRALFLCWPPYASSMAAAALRYYTGDIVIYVGEIGGCTADENFHDALYENFSVDHIEIPQYDCVNDMLHLCRRKP